MGAGQAAKMTVDSPYLSGSSQQKFIASKRVPNSYVGAQKIGLPPINRAHGMNAVLPENIYGAQTKAAAQHASDRSNFRISRESDIGMDSGMQ